MAQKIIKFLMWRRINKSSVDSLTGASPGQYDIRLGALTEKYEEFFASVPRQSPTTLGGYTLQVPIHRFDGPDPVEQTAIEVRFMGPNSERKDWNIPSQRPTTAYPLWRVGRGLPVGYQYSDADQFFVVIARDEDDQFHARWLDASRLTNLPASLRDQIASNPNGSVIAASAVSKKARDIVARLKRHYNVLLYGPPGTGKTHLIQEIVSAMTGGDSYLIDTASESIPIVQFGADKDKIKYEMVTFHQSYSVSVVFWPSVRVGHVG